jgi:hypothetical protein
MPTNPGTLCLLCVPVPDSRMPCRFFQRKTHGSSASGQRRSGAPGVGDCLQSSPDTGGSSIVPQRRGRRRQMWQDSRMDFREGSGALGSCSRGPGFHD